MVILCSTGTDPTASHSDSFLTDAWLRYLRGWSTGGYLRAGLPHWRWEGNDRVPMSNSMHYVLEEGVAQESLRSPTCRPQYRLSSTAPYETQIFDYYYSKDCGQNLNLVTFGSLAWHQCRCRPVFFSTRPTSSSGRFWQGYCQSKADCVVSHFTWSLPAKLPCYKGPRNALSCFRSHRKPLLDFIQAGSFSFLCHFKLHLSYQFAESARLS